jgi:hypothetical protein
MRKYLPFAMLFICATAVQAQEPVAQEPVEATTVETAQAAASIDASVTTDRTPAPAIDLKTRSATATAVDAATMRAPAPDVDNVTQDIDAPNNWWWMVGGIVLAGVILALIL